jgi:hypothetical protein
VDTVHKDRWKINIRTARSFKKMTADEMADVRKRAVMGQGVYSGTTTEYWKKPSAA